MSRWPALAPLRIGCVRYLNARPLIHAYDGPVVFEHPSALAAAMIRGELDAALVPIYEALGARPYRLVDGVAIASDGPVFSVILAHRGPLAEVRTIALDPASLTSVHLLKVLLAEFHGTRPEFVEATAFPHAADAVLLIGNQAIDFRRGDIGASTILDLGEEWRRCTGLPFVYAAWLLRRELPDARAVAEAFRALKEEGAARLGEIIAGEAFADRAFRERYLTQHIRFGLGIREKAGVEKFRELLAKHGINPMSAASLEWI